MVVELFRLYSSPLKEELEEKFRNKLVEKYPNLKGIYMYFFITKSWFIDKPIKF